VLGAGLRRRPPAARQVSPFPTCHQSSVDNRLSPSPTRGSRSGAGARKCRVAMDRDERQAGRGATERCPVRETEHKRGAILKLPKSPSLLRAIRMSPSHRCPLRRPRGHSRPWRRSGPSVGRCYIAPVTQAAARARFEGDATRQACFPGQSAGELNDRTHGRTQDHERSRARSDRR
jgi:hypothetical protein